MEQIDNEGLICTALRAAGYNIDENTTEVFLQLSDFARNNPDATFKDIVRIKAQADELNGIDEDKNEVG